jgi:hypothetical protein
LIKETNGSTGGRASIARRSVVIAILACVPVRRGVRSFATDTSQSCNWELKSWGETNTRPGRNEVSRYLFARSTIPLDSGSRGLSRTKRVARDAAKNAAGFVNVLRPPIPASLSQTNLRGTSSTSPMSLPRPREQVSARARRNHPRRDKPRKRGHHHQHRWRPQQPITQRNLHRREPQITLTLITSAVLQPIRQIHQRQQRP